MLLPVEIENAKFSRSVGGYTPAEVDEFLDYIKSKCAENADAEARLAVSVNEVKVLGNRIAELEAQMEAITAERDELKVKNDELKNALAEAIAQAAAKAVETLPVNNAAADPVWDPDADEEIPEPFRVEGDGAGKAEIDEPESDGSDGAAEVADAADAVETEVESEDNDQDVAAEARTEEFGDLENIFSHLDDIGDIVDVADEQADAREIIETDDINDADTDIDIDVDIDGTDTISTARSDEDIAATLEAVLASLDIKPHDAPKTNVKDLNAYEGIDVSLDFDEIEGSDEDSAGAAETDDNDGADEFEFSFDTADDINAANVEDTKDVENAAVAVDAVDAIDDVETVEDVEDVEDVNAIETVEAIETIDSVDDVDDADSVYSVDAAPLPPTQYARRVYRMRLKRAAKRHDEDQAILDALRAAYDEDDVDDDDDDLTQHEYDQYHYTFDSGKK